MITCIFAAAKPTNQPSSWGLACLVLFVYPRMPRAARTRHQATRPAPPAMRRSKRNIRPPARLINPAASLDAAAVSSTATSVSSFNDSSAHTTPSVTTTNSNSILASSSLIQDITQAVTHQVLQTLSTQGVVAAGITVPLAAPPPFQLSHDGALAAPLRATAGADASVQGSVASVLHNLSGEPLGVGTRAPGQVRPRDVFTPHESFH